MVSAQNKGSNKLLLLPAVLLMVLGIVIVYTASAPLAERLGLSTEYYLLSHLKKVLVAIAALVFCYLLDYSAWKKFARVFFAVGVILTIAALVSGTSVKGASRWIWGIQPSEILKLGFITMVCAKLSDAGDEIKTLRCSIIQPAVPFVISAVLLELQPNMSMLILFALVLLAVLFAAGARGKYLLICICSAIPVGIGGLMYKAHSSKRLLAFLHPEEHAESAFQLMHSQQALGNGGLFGTGVGMGMQKLGYLPEAHKDVVFSVIGEEFGFVGTFIVMILFATLFWQGFNVARSSSSRFGKYMAVAITFSLFCNFMIHTCVCTGLFPTTGQPLPFLSFGGTNLIFSSAMIGVMLNISKPTSGRTIREPFMNNTVSLNINFMKKPDYARRGA